MPDAAPLTVFETKSTSNLVQIPRIGQQENYPEPLCRPIGSGHDRDSCPDQSTFRDQPCGESLDGELVLQSANFDDGEMFIEQEESNMQQRQSVSSQVLVVHTTKRSKKNGTIRHQLLLHPVVKTNPSIGESMNMREGLYCYGLPVLGGFCRVFP